MAEDLLRSTLGPSERLGQLRDCIDGVDEEIVSLLAERLRIVGEVARLKGEGGRQIRDLSREREILQRRAEQADRAGFPPALVESIYRLLLLASRERQSEILHQERRAEECRRVALIGGKGEMGQCMARLFQRLGHEVVIADLDTTSTPVEAAKSCDLVVVSVPIRLTCQVIEEVAPHVRPNALLADVTSIKDAAMQSMMQHSRCSVVGLHPMFGPGVHSFEGQRVVMCRGRGDSWYDWLANSFAAMGLRVTEAQPTVHDRVMAIVQVLNHFQTQVLGLALARVGVDLQDTLDFTSPAYLLEAYITARHFAQSPRLYGAIEMLNPSTGHVSEVFVAAAREIASMLEQGDQVAFNKMFEEVRDFFGDFSREAEEQSGFLIDRLVELSTGESLG